MKTLWLTVVVFFASFLPAQAQLANIVQLNALTFAPGVSPVTGVPTANNVYAPITGATVCNQVAPVVPATVVNPTRFFFDDDVNVGRVCIFAIAATLLPSLPNLPGYTMAVTVTDNLGAVSPRSAASPPFGVQGIPAARTGLKVVSSLRKLGMPLASLGHSFVPRSKAPRPMRFETLR